MKKMIAGAFVGLVIVILGIYVWYVYMTTFLDEGNHSLFALSLIQIGIGIYILFKASHTTEDTIQDELQKVENTPHGRNFGSLLRRNSELMQSWHKTADFKDKLTVLKTSAEEQTRIDQS